MQLATRDNNKILGTPLPHISSSEKILPRPTRRTFAQLRKINHTSSKYTYIKLAQKHIHTPMPLYKTPKHGTHHIFNCTHIRTTLSHLDLWIDPAGVSALPTRWMEKLAGGTQAGRSGSPQLQGSWEWVDNNNHIKPMFKLCYIAFISIH